LAFELQQTLLKHFDVLTQIVIIAQWPESAERSKICKYSIENRSEPAKNQIFTTSAFGLSYIRIIFDDDVDDVFARQRY
jgi:cobalt-zinc-cadmium resistance protein CzcA